jgi:hypothetical protein
MPRRCMLLTLLAACAPRRPLLPLLPSPCRLLADLTMLMAAGDGKERDEHQTGALLDAAGFKMHRMVGTTGLMIVMEAKPVPLPAAAAAAAGGKAARKKAPAKSKNH